MPTLIRPYRIRRVCWVLAPVVVVVFALLGTGLKGSTGDNGGTYQSSDQIAMGVLGLFIAAGILLFTRPKVVADDTHIVIQNVLGGYDLPWSVVRAIRLDRGNPWLTLELTNDDIVSVMAVQTADKERAVASARALRAHFTAAKAAPTEPTGAASVAPEPVTAEPATAGPVTAEPAAAEPATAEPAQ